LDVTVCASSPAGFEDVLPHFGVLARQIDVRIYKRDGVAHKAQIHVAERRRSGLRELRGEIAASFLSLQQRCHRLLRFD
jgi:hypothetical protein